MSDLEDPDVRLSLRNGVITVAVVEDTKRACVRLSIDDAEALIKRLETLCDKAIQEEKGPVN